jgi:O-antigen/teichoic acid export membrane protein
VIDRANVARSAAWRAVEMAGSEGISFLSFLVMARLLVPEEFGVVAIAGAIVQLAAVVLHRGLPDALIQASNLDDEQVRSALTLSLIGGCALVLAIVAVAWPLGWLLERSHFPVILVALARCCRCTRSSGAGSSFVRSRSGRCAPPRSAASWRSCWRNASGDRGRWSRSSGWGR